MYGRIQDAASGLATSTQRVVIPAPPIDAYLPWDSPGVEQKEPNEKKKVAEIQETIKRMQKHNFDKHRYAFRATHARPCHDIGHC